MKLEVSPKLELACYAHRHLDSSLAVFINSRFWLLNINDTELNETDISIIKRHWGSPSVLYNQFSIAGSEGIESYLPANAQDVLDKMIQHHVGLKAKLTVPFASFVKFARKDNDFMNSYANSPIDAKQRFKDKELQICLQSYKSDPLAWADVSELPINLDRIDSESTTEFARTFTGEIAEKDFSYKVITQDIVKNSIEDRLAEWKDKTTQLLWKKLEPIRVKVDDWQSQVWVINFQNLKFYKSDNQSDYDILINSQPLDFAFKLPFGIQTLGVSGRYRFHPSTLKIPRTWKLIRVISSLYNAEVYLSIKGIFRLSTLKWIWQRKSGLFAQVYQQFKRLFSK